MSFEDKYRGGKETIIIVMNKHTKNSYYYEGEKLWGRKKD
jgi:hypothetical protein